MKSVIYVLLGIFAFGIIATAITRNSSNSSNSKLLTIQSVDKSISTATLSKSAEIVQKRLKYYSDEKFEIAISPEKNQIQIKLSEDWNIKTAARIAIQKGNFEFYETINLNELKTMLDNDNTLFSMLGGNETVTPSAKIGCTSLENAYKVNDYLNTSGLAKKCLFMWSSLFDNSNVCLYALKPHNSAVMPAGKDIQNFKLIENKSIEFKFCGSAIENWATITSQNLNKAIAITLDNSVIYAPIVREVITGGNCAITGDFTTDQLKFITCIGSYGELPVEFSIPR